MKDSIVWVSAAGQISYWIQSVNDGCHRLEHSIDVRCTWLSNNESWVMGPEQLVQICYRTIALERESSFRRNGFKVSVKSGVDSVYAAGCTAGVNENPYRTDRAARFDCTPATVTITGTLFSLGLSNGTITLSS